MSVPVPLPGPVPVPLSFNGGLDTYHCPPLGINDRAATRDPKHSCGHVPTAHEGYSQIKATRRRGWRLAKVRAPRAAGGRERGSP
ncbi:hypothetical protein EVAR_90827_1 [Eumeta japonica]|uniref:Uncharacterized protein n=1 Tax=Eumeta variegata TaxID=151549 RepID=A0A4C1ZVZ3_EUMVA|nr:hypothetical protein EVAR_90827_1 [Eumeta japonica]